jgi:hypothetical protein
MKAGDVIEIPGDGSGMLWAVDRVNEAHGLVTANRLSDGLPSGWKDQRSCRLLPPRAALRKLMAMRDRLCDALNRVDQRIAALHAATGSPSDVARQG